MASEDETVAVVMRKWPGTILDADSHDIQPGAGEYVNADSRQQGKLMPRRGLIELTLE